MNFSLPESHGERHVENKFDDIMASQEEAIMVCLEGCMYGEFKLMI